METGKGGGRNEGNGFGAVRIEFGVWGLGLWGCGAVGTVGLWDCRALGLGAVGLSMIDQTCTKDITKTT